MTAVRTYKDIPAELWTRVFDVLQDKASNTELLDNQEIWPPENVRATFSKLGMRVEAHANWDPVSETLQVVIDDKPALVSYDRIWSEIAQEIDEQRSALPATTQPHEIQASAVPSGTSDVGLLSRPNDLTRIWSGIPPELADKIALHIQSLSQTFERDTTNSWTSSVEEIWTRWVYNPATGVLQATILQKPEPLSHGSAWGILEGIVADDVNAWVVEHNTTDVEIAVPQISHTQARQIFGRAVPHASAKQSLFIRAQSWFESGYGTGWDGDGAGSHNWGAVTAGPEWPGPTFQHADSYWTPEGVRRVSPKFRIYPSDEAGVADQYALVAKNWPKALTLADADDWKGAAAALFGYYRGNVPPEQAKADYYRNLWHAAKQIAKETGETLPPEQSTTNSTVVAYGAVGALAVGGVVLAVLLAKRPRGRRRRR
jgi:hypothetical protein